MAKLNETMIRVDKGVRDKLDDLKFDFRVKTFDQVIQGLIESKETRGSLDVETITKIEKAVESVPMQFNEDSPVLVMDIVKILIERGI